jgi:hypothetical protein
LTASHCTRKDFGPPPPPAPKYWMKKSAKNISCRYAIYWKLWVYLAFSILCRLLALLFHTFSYSLVISHTFSAFTKLSRILAFLHILCPTLSTFSTFTIHPKLANFKTKQKDAIGTLLLSWNRSCFCLQMLETVGHMKNQYW